MLNDIGRVLGNLNAPEPVDKESCLREDPGIATRNVYALNSNNGLINNNGKVLNSKMPWAIRDFESIDAFHSNNS
jgi:hypothetical protein